jgi:hypothetical protein
MKLNVFYNCTVKTNVITSYNITYRINMINTLNKQFSIMKKFRDDTFVSRNINKLISLKYFI